MEGSLFALGSAILASLPGSFFLTPVSWENSAQPVSWGMRILGAPAQVELVIQRSRFLGLAQPVADPGEARSLIKDAKVRYADATHVVHAFRTGSEGSETLGCSDDGEPAGTAGRPVLEVLKGAGGGALLLVVRWFGGTKLGTGGLVRAYSDVAKALVAAVRWDEARNWVDARITVDWAQHRPLTAELAARGARIIDEVFADGVLVNASVPEEEFEALQRFTTDLTRGRAGWVTRD
jgi:uncharacterized YigZ family protein